MRGGAWNNNPQNARVSNRNRNEPTNRNNNIGFRCAVYAGRRGSRRLYGVSGRANSASRLGIRTPRASNSGGGPDFPVAGANVNPGVSQFELECG